MCFTPELSNPFSFLFKQGCYEPVERLSCRNGLRGLVAVNVSLASRRVASKLRSRRFVIDR